MPVANAYAPLSILTCTFFTPEPVSLAVPLTATVAVFRVAPLDGEDIATVGGVVSIILPDEVDKVNLPLLAGSLLNIGHSYFAGLEVGISKRYTEIFFPSYVAAAISIFPLRLKSDIIGGVRIEPDRLFCQYVEYVIPSLRLAYL